MNYRSGLLFFVILESCSSSPQVQQTTAQNKKTNDVKSKEVVLSKKVERSPRTRLRENRGDITAYFEIIDEAIDGENDWSVQSTAEIGIQNVKNSARLNFLLGASHFKLGQHFVARDLWKKCIEIDKSFQPCKASLALLYAQYGNLFLAQRFYGELDKNFADKFPILQSLNKNDSNSENENDVQSE